MARIFIGHNWRPFSRISTGQRVLWFFVIRTPFKLLAPLLLVGAGSSFAENSYYLPAGYTLTPFISDKPVREFKEVPKFSLQKGIDYLAVFETSAGRIVIDLFEDKTPITVNSFVFLTRNHFYDGLGFHRVIKDFVVQLGDPKTLNEKDKAAFGTGGAGNNYKFGLEIRQDLKFDAKGIVGMARGGDPDSNGSQFYISLSNKPNVQGLTGQYTVFGKVIEGLDILDKVVVGEPPEFSKMTRVTRAYIVQKAK